ncbi:MAG TPA: pyridoxamine 5'-phosphate oxidase family protein [Solirubrobacteraceae bacterium]|nr:pyridoxamine 5'-phosphate oxidase family protein [Solirubrobacteraceae bacterium]
MSEAEVASFLADERTVTCATMGPRGWPHLMPLWYVLRAPESSSQSAAAAAAGENVTSQPQIWAWTYAVSQKVRNLERDQRASLQVEAGEQYQELRGVMFECDVIVHRDIEIVAALGHEIFMRYATPRGEPPVDELPPEVGAMVQAQAAKRVALQFVERRRATWDHRKLAGVY